MSDGISDPGSSVYLSDTMYVGDGTWDSQRNTFLLPNLQGPNFETMRLNGMGNRFRSMTGYKALITAHGVLATITFLFVIPAAIFMARFYHRNPRTALRFHIWLQVSAVLLSTAAIICSFQAVGLERSLSNPHHGIGVALYTLVMVQALGGSVIHRLEKGKERYKIPLKLMIHQWLGRTIALLGVAQIPLGLTLYGSPLVLFILFAVWTFVLVILYCVLSWRSQPEMDFDDRSTYITDRSYSTRRSRRSRGPGVGKLAAAGAAGAGLAALGSRRSRSRTRSRHGGTVLSSRPDSRSRRDSRSRVTDSEFTESYLSDEKYGDDRKKGYSWKERILGAGAAAGGIFAMKKLFNRKDKRPPTETGSDFSYSRPLGPSEVTQTDISRLEEGRAPESPAHRRDDWRRVEERDTQVSAMTGSNLRSSHHPTRTATSMDSFDSRTSFSEETEMRPKDRSYGLKEGVAALGVFGFLKHSLGKRSKKKENERVEEMREQDLEEERIARMNSQRRKKYTGDRTPPRGGRRPPSTIVSDSELTGITPSVARPPMDSTVTPNPHRPPRAGVYSVLSDSGSEAYDSPGGRHHNRRRTTDAPVIPTGAAAAGTVTSMGSPSKHDRRGSRDDVASPPVSVKVKMHNDGRHVTLRRLNEEEAAAEREARRRDRKGKNRAGSVSSLSGVGGDRWRRTEAMERAQAQEMAQQAGIPPPPPLPNSGPLRMPEATIPPPPPGGPMFSQEHGNIPPPPPIPASDTVMSSPPPGTQFNGTETDLSNYDSNRRRRRAERAQAKQARLGGSRVEFS